MNHPYRLWQRSVCRASSSSSDVRPNFGGAYGNKPSHTLGSRPPRWSCQGQPGIAAFDHLAADAN